MTKTHTKYFKFLMLFIFTIFVCISCTILEKEVTIYNEFDYYLIDSDTILTKISSGNLDNLTQVNEEDIPKNNLPSGIPVQWNLKDYIKIAQALNNLTWNDTSGDWQLNMISTDWDCQYFQSGPQSAQIRYFKTEQNDNEKIRLVSLITIEPQKSLVTLHKKQQSPQIIEWDFFDQNQLEISMESALGVAENNGGYQARKLVDNKCFVLVSQNAASTIHEGWIIDYVSETLERLDIFYIDPETGNQVNKK